MHPYLFNIGDFTVGTFGLCMVAGFIVSWILLKTEIKRRGLKKGIDVDMLLGAMVGGIVGAKGWYIVEHWGEFISDPGAYLFTGGGLVWYGGLIFGFVGAYIALLIHKQKFGRYADALAPSLAIGLAIGRVG